MQAARHGLPGGASSCDHGYTRLITDMTDRYYRHYLIPEIGREGQHRLRASAVLLIGLGGLGSPAALYLAAAGVGTLGLVDGDCVEISNLQRQVIHRTGDIGRSKVDSAAETIRELNPDVALRYYREYATHDLLAGMVQDYDIVISAPDTFDARLMINDCCVAAGVPCVHAGVSGIEGQVMTTLPGTACYRCAFVPSGDAGLPEAVSPIGTLGVAAALGGTLQAAEVLKYLCGYGELMTDRILLFDLAGTSLYSVPVRKRQECRTCGVTGHPVSGSK
ncbi:MAG: HesA/MoeB/ThiF family protein [Prosthecochloris sp.]|nr:HesA/MoeB/ThiF family protein [Prosthecochloris sp.]